MYIKKNFVNNSVRKQAVSLQFKYFEFKFFITNVSY